jgi:hypothetical protein
MKGIIKRLHIKPPTKKFWAREFLIIIILTVVSASAYFISEKRNSNIQNKIEIVLGEINIIQNKIDGYGSNFFKHWVLLKANGAFEGDYESFRNEYGDYSKRFVLWKLTENNYLLTNDQNKTLWFEEMYTKSYHLTELYLTLKKNQAHSTEQFLKYRWWESYPDNYTDMLFSNEEAFKKNYELYVLYNGYYGSIEHLKKTISTDTQTLNINPDKYFSLLPSLESKKKERYKLFIS